MKESIVFEKALAFAIRIVKVYRWLCEEKREYTISKELLLAGSHIGKHVRAAHGGESRDRFITEMAVALRKAIETEYWLLLLFHSSYISQSQFDSLDGDRIVLARLLTKIVKTSRGAL